MKTILVPIDFSVNSKNALNYAILLAQALKMKLLLLHTSQPAEVEIPITDPQVELDLWCRAIAQSGSGVSCNGLHTKGRLPELVIEKVEENLADLVVMGTKGATGLKGIFLGSNTTGIIEEVPCPVIAVPENYHFKGLQKIVFATDYHDSDVASIRFVIELASKMNAELNVIHVANEDRKMRLEDILLQHFKEKVEQSVSYDKMTFHLLEGGDVIKELNNFINQQKADLLAVSNEKGIFSGPLFNHGVTKKIVNHIQVPVFAFHAYDDKSENELF